jgi:hypothetical protein
MKLDIKIYNAQPRIEKLRFDSQVVELLDAYVEFYQAEFKTSFSTEQVIVQMLLKFIKSDRNFMRWYRNKKSDKPL